MSQGDTPSLDPSPASTGFDIRRCTQALKGRRALVAISIAAVIVRIIYVLLTNVDGTDYDATWYHTVGNGLAHGVGWQIRAPLIASPEYMPTAYFPPLFPLMLAGVSLTGLESLLAHRLVAAALGGMSVLFTGLLGERFGGRRVAIVAAGIASVYPMFVAADGSLMSEALYLPLVTSATLVALIAQAQASWKWFSLLGVVGALAALTRSEGAVVFVVLVVGATLTLGSVPLRRRLALPVTSLAVAACLVLPWVISASERFDQFVPVSNNATTVVRGANCESTYVGEREGYWDYNCLGTLRPGSERLDEAEFGDVIQQEGIEYALDHVSQLPRVAVVRSLRTWGLWPFGDQAEWEALEARNVPVVQIGRFSALALVPFAAVGILVSRRRQYRLWPLVSLIVVVTLMSALTYGNQRFRIAAEPGLVILAAVGLLACAANPFGRHRPGEPVPGHR